MRLAVEARIERPGGFRLEVALDVEADALGVFGPSGGGKTTLLDAIAGVERGARVVIDGRDLTPLPLERRDVGYVMQDALLFPHLSVRENLLYGARAQGVEEVARALGIEPLLDRMPRHLSGGERKRVALGRAIASRPRLLLLDEPFAGLDAARRREAMSLLDEVRRRFSLPIVFVSHLPEEVAGLADHAIRLEAGRAVESGPSLSILRGAEVGALDNLFAGSVVAPGRVRVGEVELHALVPPDVTGDVRLACYAHDIVLAGERPRAISARNCFATTVASIDRAGETLVIGLAAPRLRAIVTEEAARELELRPGVAVVAIVKATSIVYAGAARGS